MSANDVDACLLTSYHNICYYSGFLYCGFGRSYGFVVTLEAAITISAGIDGGQPWRRTHGDNLSHTDWRRDNFFYAVQQLTAGVKRLGIEFDHITVDLREQLQAALPSVSFVDLGQPTMWMHKMCIRGLARQ